MIEPIVHLKLLVQVKYSYVYNYTVLCPYYSQKFCSFSLLQLGNRLYKHSPGVVLHIAVTNVQNGLPPGRYTYLLAHPVLAHSTYLNL